MVDMALFSKSRKATLSPKMSISTGELYSFFGRRVRFRSQASSWAWSEVFVNSEGAMLSEVMPAFTLSAMNFWRRSGFCLSSWGLRMNRRGWPVVRVLLRMVLMPSWP